MCVIVYGVEFLLVGEFSVLIMLYFYITNLR